MDQITNTTLVQLVILLTTISIFWKYKRNGRKIQEGKHGRRWKTYGFTDVLKVTYMLFERPKIIAGQKESRFQKLYNKYLSSSSSYVQEPYLLKIFGKTIGLAAVDPETIYELHKNDAFNDRTARKILELYAGGKPGGIIMNNQRGHWKEMKQFTMKKLSQLGFGKRHVMTSILSDQLPELLDHIDRVRKESENKIQVKDLFSAAVINIILVIFEGRKFSHEDPDFIQLHNAVVKLTNYHIFKLLFIVLSGNIRGIRELFGYSRMAKVRDNFLRLIKKFISEREALGIYKENPESVVDYFLQEIENHKDIDNLEAVYNKHQLGVLFQDFILAGMDTTSNFLESFLMYMCLYPDVQNKVHQEIDSVLGTSAVPRYYECKPKMQYTLAAIYEAHRLSTIVPIIPRMTTRDVEIRGQFLKRGTLVACAMFALRFDDVYWKDASVFSPERFLDCNGRIISAKVDRMLFFGKGARVCPAENIAPAVAFTFVTGFLQKYTVKKQNDSEILSLKENFGATVGPDPFHISIYER